jgi:hypothetical protein
MFKQKFQVVVAFLGITLLVQGCGAPKSSSSLQDDWWTRRNPERAAIEKCLAKWGTSPFQANSSYRTVQAAVGWTRGEKIFIDATQTNAPELILVPAIVSVFGTVTYRLQNPNGWYCLSTSVGVRGETRVEIPASAHLADSVQVNVGGQDQHPGMVNVKVDGSVQVIVGR